MVRKHIVLPEDIDALVRRLAGRRGVSQSAIIVEAVRALAGRDRGRMTRTSIGF